MVHTFEIYKKISKYVYQNLINSGLFSYNSNNRGFYYADFEKLKEKGINKIFLKSYSLKNNNDNGYFIRIVINPSKMFDKNANAVSILNMTDFDYGKLEQYFSLTMEEAFKNKLQNSDAMNIVYCLADIHNYSITRIDYCINLFLSNQQEVDQYLKLLSKGDIPHKYGAKFTRNRCGCYYVNERVNINFYNKFFQMLTHNKQTKTEEKKYSQAELDSAKKILRLEVQCKSKMFGSQSFKKRYGNDRTQYFSSIIARDILYKYLVEVSQNGDYYKYSKVYEKIELQRPNNFNPSKRKTICRYQKMMNLFREVSKPNCKGLWSYRKKLSKDKSKKMNEDLKLFDEIGVNVITIPSTYKKDSLPNLWKIAEEQHFHRLEA